MQQVSVPPGEWERTLPHTSDQPHRGPERKPLSFAPGARAPIHADSVLDCMNHYFRNKDMGKLLDFVTELYPTE